MSSSSSYAGGGGGHALVDTTDHGRKRKNGDHHQRAAIFSPHLSVGPHGVGGGGTWTGASTTNTKQSKTLFVTNVDPRVQLEAISALFQKEKGFFAFRTVRRMCFVDFHSIADANIAMRKYQHHVFPQINDCRKLLIDYDKDDVSKRNTQFEAQIGRAIDESKHLELLELSCAVCSQFLMKLRLDLSLPKAKTFQQLPRREIDGSVVIDTAKYLVELQMGKGEEKAIRRAAGVEMQYRLICKACSLPVAYSSTPFDATIKHIFILDGAIKADRKEIKGGKIVRDGQRFFVITKETKQQTQHNETTIEAAAATTTAAAASSSSSSSADPSPSASSAAAPSSTAPAIPAAASSSSSSDVAPPSTAPPSAPQQAEQTDSTPVPIDIDTTTTETAAAASAATQTIATNPAQTESSNSKDETK